MLHRRELRTLRNPRASGAPPPSRQAKHDLSDNLHGLILGGCCDAVALREPAAASATARPGGPAARSRTRTHTLPCCCFTPPRLPCTAERGAGARATSCSSSPAPAPSSSSRWVTMDGWQCAPLAGSWEQLSSSSPACLLLPQANQLADLSQTTYTPPQYPWACVMQAGTSTRAEGTAAALIAASSQRKLKRTGEPNL